MKLDLELRIKFLEEENARIKNKSDHVKSKTDYVKEENLMALHEKHLPRCITYRNWKLWHSTIPRAGKAGLCEDCTPEYQNEQCMLGKCDHPEILFYFDEDGLLYGSQVPRNSENAINIKMEAK